MAYDPGALEAALSKALGDDEALIAELRALFLARVHEHVAVMAAAQTPAAWQSAAMRLQSLAASFGAVRIMELAQGAVQAETPDGRVVRKIERAIWALTG